MVKRHWSVCSTCHMMILFRERHSCPDPIQAQMDEDLDSIVALETENWSQQVDEFWVNKDIKFYEWLAKQKRL